MKIDVIENNLWADHFLVRCNCHCEFIEFVVFNKEADEDQYFYLEYFGDNYKAKKRSTSFVFNLKTFTSFVKHLKTLINIKDVKKFIIGDSSEDRKGNVRPYILKVCKNYSNIKDDNDLLDYSILLFKNLKDVNKLNKCIWEICLDENEMDELFSRLCLMKEKVE